MATSRTPGTRRPRSNKPRIKVPTTVPVASRDAAARRATAAPKRKRVEMLKGDILGVAVLITVVLIVLIAIAVPLRNYYSGRAEIARLEASIESKKEHKADLQEQLDRYNDPEYAKQEARRRLGMMEPGETAWRIIDPRMDVDHLTTGRMDDIDPDTPWTTILWDSLREVPEVPVAPEAPQEPPADAPVDPPVEEHAPEPVEQ